jgi:hypothetical protein
MESCLSEAYIGRANPPAAGAGRKTMAECISSDNLELLKSNLINLVAGRSVSISGGDFKKLTGDDIAEFGSEGRLMMGNLAALTNCQLDTTGGTAVFTKHSHPVSSIWHSSAHEAHLVDTR